MIGLLLLLLATRPDAYPKHGDRDLTLTRRCEHPRNDLYAGTSSALEMVGSRAAAPVISSNRWTCSEPGVTAKRRPCARASSAAQKDTQARGV